MHSDGKKLRSFLALLFAAGDLRRSGGAARRRNARDERMPHRFVHGGALIRAAGTNRWSVRRITGRDCVSPYYASDRSSRALCHQKHKRIEDNWMVGRLEYVPLREIWKHEAYDFTTWLFENCDVLNEQLGLTISPIEKEKSVGPFNVDILGEDSAGRAVIIENQLTRTDHDHLGKLLTYMSNLDAKVAIWVSTDPRPEHVTAINFDGRVKSRILSNQAR